MSDMTLIDHLRELKQRLIIVVACWLITAVGGYTLAEQLYQFLLQPLNDLYAGEEGRRLIFTSLTEPFVAYLKLSVLLGFVVTLPIIIWQLYRFVAPGLYRHERQVMLPFVLGAPLLFLLGAAIAYYGIMPLAWGFFLGFEVAPVDGNLPIQLEARVSEYLALVIRLIVAFGLAFQLPLLLLLLGMSGFATRAGLAAKRKYIVLGVFVFAAVITPPDVISQLGLALPLLLLFELSLYMVGMVERKETVSNDND